MPESRLSVDPGTPPTKTPATVAAVPGHGRLVGVDMVKPNHSRRLIGVSDPSPRRFGSMCCWPNCDKPGELEDIPLCLRHLTKAWRTFDQTYMSLLRMRSERAGEVETRERIKRRDERGVVYFIRFGDRVKIGFTTNLAGRLADLPHDEVLGTVPGAMADERRCHAAFAHLRVTGEWFRAEPELLSFIEDVTRHLPIGAPAHA